MSAKNEDMVTITVPRSFLRYVQVDPSEFLKLKTELGLTNKECADAISRTVSRVSELTHSKGASQEVYDRVASAWREFAENKAAAPAAAE